MKSFVLLLLPLLCAVGRADVPATNMPSSYRALRAALRASAVPVLVPIPLPQSIGTVRSIAVIDADRSGYYIGFSPLPQCGGGSSCTVFHMAGYPRSNPPERPDPRDRRVRLNDGTPALLRPRDCSGAGCTEASLTFERGGTEYELDMKGGEETLAELKSAYANLRLLR